MNIFVQNLKNKRKLLFIIISLLLFIFLLPFLIPLKADGKNKIQLTPKAVNGVINFNSNSLYKKDSIEVKGDWDFYKNQFLKPDDIANNQIPKKSGTLYFPGTANQFPVKKGSKEKIGPFSYGSFLLKVSGIKNNFPFSFEISGVSSNFDFTIIQGQEIFPMGGYGIVGTNERKSISQFGKLLGDFTSNGNDFYILIRASNYHYRGLGILSYFKIVTQV